MAPGAQKLSKMHMPNGIRKNRTNRITRLALPNGFPCPHAGVIGSHGCKPAAETCPPIVVFGGRRQPAALTGESPWKSGKVETCRSLPAELPNLIMIRIICYTVFPIRIGPLLILFYYFITRESLFIPAQFHEIRLSVVIEFPAEFLWSFSTAFVLLVGVSGLILISGGRTRTTVVIALEFRDTLHKLLEFPLSYPFLIKIGIECAFRVGVSHRNVSGKMHYSTVKFVSKHHEKSVYHDTEITAKLELASGKMHYSSFRF